MTRRGLPFVAGGDGHVECHLLDIEIDLLCQLPDLARRAVDDDEIAGRLLPDAFPDDAALSREFAELTRADLVNGKLRAIDRFEATLPRPGPEEVEFALEPDDSDAWLTVIHDARYALGVQLDVDENSTSGDLEGAEPGLLAYAYLCDLESVLVAALADGLEGWR